MDGDNAPPAGETFQDKVRKAVEGVITLHVTTVIGTASIQNAADGGAVSTVVLEAGAPKVANTVINMALGDSTTIYSQDFVSDPALLAIHNTAIETAHTVRKETIDILKTALEDFKDLFSPQHPQV